MKKQENATPGRSSPQVLLDGIKVILEFDAEGGISGFAGCNTYFGSVETKGEKLSVGAIALVAAPLAAIWVGIGWMLGVRQEELAQVVRTQADGLEMPYAEAPQPIRRSLR